jgi:outer membrane lipopolysaccharide assembly protein LptE/RlpB
VIAKGVQPKIVLAALLALSLVGGCGYRQVAQRGPLSEANGVNVTLFANRSYRPGVEGILARDLVDEFALRSGGKVLPGEKAQLELTGVVLSYGTLPVSYTAQDTIKEYRAVITVQATLRELQTQKVLWKGDLAGEQTFPVNANIALQQNAEEAAIAKICRRLSEDIWQKIGERF